MTIARWALDVFQHEQDIAFEVSKYKGTYDTALVCIRSLHSAEADPQKQLAYNELVDDIFARGEEFLSFANRTVV